MGLLIARRPGAGAAVVLLLASACSTTYEGTYVAEVEVTTEGPVATKQTRTESITITEPDESLEDNGLFVERAPAGGPACRLKAIRRGGFGLRFPGGERCARDGQTWRLKGGGAPNDRADVLTIDLQWIIEGPTLALEGAARERLSIRR